MKASPTEVALDVETPNLTFVEMEEELERGTETGTMCVEHPESNTHSMFVAEKDLA